jgi:hypothetical protein
MRLVIKPLGVATLMVSATAVAAIAIYATGPKPAPVDPSGFGNPVSPVAAIPVPAHPAPSPSAAASASSAAAPAPVLPVTRPLLETSLDNWSLTADSPAQATRTLVADPSAPNAEKRYLHGDITKIDPKSFWIVQFNHGVDVDVPAGQKFVMRLVARSKTKNHVQAVFIRNGGDHHSDVSSEIYLTPEWKTYSFPFTTSRTYLANSVDDTAAVCLHCGQQVGTVDVATFQVYPASSKDAAK